MNGMDLPDPAEAYAEARERIKVLVRGLSSEQAGQVRVTACPGWTIHDVIAHLVGNARDILSGRMDGIGTDAWTAEQVLAARANDLVALLTEWDQISSKYEDVLRAVGRRAEQAVADIVTHEQDLRAALSQPGERDIPAVLLSAAYVAELFTTVAEDRGLRILVDISGYPYFGPTDAEYVLRGSAWEVLRILTGRRSPEQIAAHIDMDRNEIREAFSFSPEGLPHWIGAAAFAPAGAPLSE